MSCTCNDPTDFTITGNGAYILDHVTLPWFLTTDGLLGTPPNEPLIPNGNINQMFWKLLQNDAALAEYMHNHSLRTFGVSTLAAPPVGAISVLPGIPASPSAGNLHTVVFSNFEVTYRYQISAPHWVEVARSERVTTNVEVREKKLTIPLTAGIVEVPFTIPDEDNNGAAFAFTMDDLALLYVNNTDIDSPVIGIVPGYNLSGAVVRVVLSAEVPEDSDYEVVAIFRKTVLS